jgi:hypothetical protein
MCPWMLDFCEGVDWGPAGASALATILTEAKSVLQLITPTRSVVSITVTTFSTLDTAVTVVWTSTARE